MVRCVSKVWTGVGLGRAEAEAEAAALAAVSRSQPAATTASSRAAGSHAARRPRWVRAEAIGCPPDVVPIRRALASAAASGNQLADVQAILARDTQELHAHPVTALGVGELVDGAA